MEHIQLASTVRETVRSCPSRIIYLGVWPANERKARTADNCHDILRVRWRRPNSWLPHAGSGFLVAGKVNNFREDIPMNDDDEISDLLESLYEEGYVVGYDPAMQEDLKKSFEKGLMESLTAF